MYFIIKIHSSKWQALGRTGVWKQTTLHQKNEYTRFTSRIITSFSTDGS